MADGGAPDSGADAPVGDGGDNPDAAPGDGGDAAVATFNFCDKASWPYWTTTNYQTADNALYRAVDGLSNTKWQTGRAQDGTEWFQIDFHGQVTMDGVTLDYTGSTGDYARGNKVYVSNSATPAETDLVATATQTAAANTFTIPFTEVTGRYLRVLQTGVGSPWWSVVEVNVNDCTVPAQTLPTWDGVVHDVSDRTTWTAMAFNQGQAVGNPANLIDTSATTYWQNGRTPLDGMWVALDLGAVGNLNGIVMTHKGTDTPVAIKVMASIDGLNFTNVLPPENAGAGIAGATTMDIAFAANTQARYLRIINVGSRGTGGWWSVGDIALKP